MGLTIHHALKQMLIACVNYAEHRIPTEPDQAIPNHRAHEALRDLLEEIIADRRTP